MQLITVVINLCNYIYYMALKPTYTTKPVPNRKCITKGKPF